MPWLFTGSYVPCQDAGIIWTSSSQKRYNHYTRTYAGRKYVKLPYDEIKSKRTADAKTWVDEPCREQYRARCPTANELKTERVASERARGQSKRALISQRAITTSAWPATLTGAANADTVRPSKRHFAYSRHTLRVVALMISPARGRSFVRPIPAGSRVTGYSLTAAAMGFPVVPPPTTTRAAHAHAEWMWQNAKCQKHIYAARPCCCSMWMIVCRMNFTTVAERCDYSHPMFEPIVTIECRPMCLCSTRWPHHKSDTGHGPWPHPRRLSVDSRSQVELLKRYQ